MVRDVSCEKTDQEAQYAIRNTQYEEFKYFYPTSCLVTAQEIIFFWVARMIMAGLEFCKKIPFEDIYIHGTVRDETGTKMSKSLGNTIDPLQVIEDFGADALRFCIISITSAGQDVFLSKDRFESGRNFANKIWNVARFVMLNLKATVDEGFGGIKKQGLSLADRWLLTSLYNTTEKVAESFDSYRFSEAANTAYDFIWHKYCDWYVEIAKASIDQKRTRVILYNVLKSSLQLLHPVMPFITEELWQALDSEESIMLSKWPKIDKQLTDTASFDCMEKAIAIIVAVRNIRAEMNIAHKSKIDILIDSSDKDLISNLDEIKVYAEKTADIGSISIKKGIKQPKSSASAILDFCKVYVLLEGKIDIPAEKSRLSKNLNESEHLLAGLSKRLKNKSFIEKAPKDIVEKEKQKEKALKDKVAHIRSAIKNLG